MKDKIFCNLREKNPLGWVVQSWVKKAQGLNSEDIKAQSIFSQFLSAI